MTIRNSPFLRWALLADAIASGSTALLMILFSGALAQLLQIPAGLLLNAGLVLVPYVALVAYLGTRERLPRWTVWAVIGANILWALDSVLVALSGWFEPNGLGYAFIVGQATVVALFAELQFIGLRRSTALTA
jgi:hypothetical protein